MILIMLRPALSSFCLLAACLVALSLPSLCSATIIVGSESNGHLINSNVTPEGQRRELRLMKAQGTQLVRANIGWNEVAAACGGATPEQLSDYNHPCYNWAIIDGLVMGAQSLGMKVLISVTRTPSWASGSSDPANMGSTDEQFVHVAYHYAAFHTAAASRYRTGSPYGTVGYWTVHNESNSATFWKPAPDPDRYGRLYALTAVAIRRASPDARIAAGPTNPTGNGELSIHPLDFIEAAQDAINYYLPGDLEERRSYIDAWAHNPYPVATGQPHRPRSTRLTHVVGMAHVGRLIEQIDAHELTKDKKLWATEFGWETRGRTSVSEQRQAQFIAEAYHWLDSWGRFEIGGSYGLTDPSAASDLQTGTYRVSGAPKPAAVMMQRMISVPAAGMYGKVPWGSAVEVWGRSNLSPRTGQLVYSVNGGPWRKVAAQKRARDGSIRATMLITSSSVRFAVHDKVRHVRRGLGAVRAVRAYVPPPVSVAPAAG